MTIITTTRDAALAALHRLAAGRRVDEYTAGKYTVFVPGRLALLVGDGAAWLCRVGRDGRLVEEEARAEWGGVGHANA